MAWRINNYGIVDIAWYGTSVEMELGNAAVDGPAYGRLRVRYCQEFLTTFAGVNWDTSMPPLDDIVRITRRRKGDLADVRLAPCLRAWHILQH